MFIWVKELDDDDDDNNNNNNNNNINNVRNIKAWKLIFSKERSCWKCKLRYRFEERSHFVKACCRPFSVEDEGTSELLFRQNKRGRQTDRQSYRGIMAQKSNLPD
jgi:hypothetical protein